MYQQQEMVYYALFNEVTEAKSLLEQVALVSQGRSMYPRVLQAMSTYVQTDLKRLQADPAVLLSSRPMDDPLETIMYLVGAAKGRLQHRLSFYFQRSSSFVFMIALEDFCGSPQYSV